MQDKEKHLAEFRVRLTEEQAQAVRKLARENGVKPAEMIRMLVVQRLAQPRLTLNIHDREPPTRK